MRDSAPFVSVIVPVRDDTEALVQCLRSLEQQSYPRDRYEIVVVDNGCTRPLEGLVAAHDGARLLQEPHAGSYRARNTGLRAARGEVVAFTDADCRPCPDWLLEGAACLCENPEAGAAVGRIRVTPQDPRRPRAVELYEMVHGFPQANYVSAHHFGATANLFTLRRVIEDVGVFDATLLSGGDREWGKRVHAAGYALRYCDTAVVDHPARNTWRALYRKFVRVHEGELGLRRRAGATAFRIGEELRRLLPPARTVWRVWSRGVAGLNGRGEKVRYSTALVGARYLGATASWQARLRTIRRRTVDLDFRQFWRGADRGGGPTVSTGCQSELRESPLNEPEIPSGGRG